jgi:alpha-galactosidase
VHLRENRRGRTGADSAYVLHAGPAGFGFAAGRVHAVHAAWSGNHVHYAERVATGECLLGGGELLLPGEIRLATGETYTSPWLYGAFGEGLDEVAHRFHRHLRARPRLVSAQRPVTLNVWEAVYFAHDRERLLDLADRAAEIGVERFVLDDGWFGARRDDRAGLGDWVVSDEVWPDGLHPLVDRVRKLGMQFGLWFEPEMVNLDSDVARAHPEWIMSARPEWPVESRHQQVLNLGIPEAYAHVKDQILALLGEYDIGYVKWDHNRDLTEAGTQADGGRPGVHAQTLAFYRLLDELRAARPDLEIESCSSGGARIDLAVLERTDRVWVSDNIDPHDRQRMLRWTGQLLPPEYLGSHIASGRSYATGRMHDLGFRAGTALFGHLGIEWDLAQASRPEIAELTAWITFYKEQRGFLLAGDLVRMDGVGDRVSLHGIVAPDRSRALFAFAPVDSLYPDPAPRLRFRGLAPERAYRVRPVLVGSAPSGLKPPLWWGEPVSLAAGFPGAVFTGAALQHVGVVAPILHPDQVLLLRMDVQRHSI